MTAARDLALARQRNYQLIIDTTLAWSAEKAVTPWAKMYRVVTAAVAKAAGVVFADTGNPDQVVATAAVRSFLDRVPTTGSIIGDIQTLDPGAITAEQETRARDIIDHWDPQFFVADLAAEPGPQGPPGPKGDKGDPGPAGGAAVIPGAVIFENLAGNDTDRTKAVNKYFQDQRKGTVLLPAREIQTSAQLELWSGMTLMGSVGVPTREYGQKTRWRNTAGAPIFKFVNNAGRYNYPSDGSPRDGTVIGVEFVGGSGTDLIERTTTIPGRTLWYWLFHNIGVNGLRSGWTGFGTGTVFGSGVSHFQAFADTVIDVGGSENSFFGSEFSFMDSKVLPDGKPFIRLRSEKSYVNQVMTTTRGNRVPLVVDGGRGSHINHVCFDAQDSDPTNGPAIIVNNHDGLNISTNTFKGMARNGGPIIDIRGGRQIVIQSNAFLCRAAGPASTPLVKVGSGVGDRQVKFGLNSVVDYSGRLVAARLAQVVNIDPTLTVEIG